MNPVVIAILVVAGIIVLFVGFMVMQFVGLWFQALVSGARVGFIDLIMMRFRKVDPKTIVFNRIRIKSGGCGWTRQELR